MHFLIFFFFLLVKTKFHFLNFYDVPPTNVDSSCLLDIRTFWIGGISRLIPIVMLFEDLFLVIIETYLGYLGGSF